MVKRFTVLSPVRLGGTTYKPSADKPVVIELDDRDGADLLRLGAVEPAAEAPAPKAPVKKSTKKARAAGEATTDTPPAGDAQS